MPKVKKVKKSGPIPVRYEMEALAAIDALAARARLDRTDAISRLVDFSLGVVDATDLIDFLMDNEASDTVLRKLRRACRERMVELVNRLDERSESETLRKARHALRAPAKDKHGRGNLERDQA